MKKLGLLLMILLMTMINVETSAQDWKAKREGKAKTFAKVAADEFGLDQNQEKTLYEEKLKQMIAMGKAKKQFEKGMITKEEKNALNKEFGSYMMKLTGKKYAELKPFFEKANKAMWGKK